MRLLVINPNSSAAVTRRIATAAEGVAAPGDHIRTLSAPSGIDLILTDEHQRRAALAVADCAAENADAVDGIVVASFGDTGIDLVRTRVRCPAIGIAEAALGAARLVGGQFAFVSFSRDLAPSLVEIAERYGMADRLAGTWLVDAPAPTDAANVQDDLFDELGELSRQAAASGVSSIVFGGGPLAGLARRLRPSVSIPLIDGTETAVLMHRALSGP